MPAPAAKAVRFSAAAHARARRIFARLIGGQSIRAIAAAERLSVRRVQQIVRKQLGRTDVNPADDYAFLQIARLERALDLIGGQIDAGKPAAAHAFVRILDLLNRLAPDRLRLREAEFTFATTSTRWRSGSIASRRRARRWCLRHAELRPRKPWATLGEIETAPQSLDNEGNREMADFAAPNHFRGLAGPTKHFVSPGEMSSRPARLVIPAQAEFSGFFNTLMDARVRGHDNRRLSRQAAPSRSRSPWRSPSRPRAPP